MTSDELRRKYLEFFESKGHKVIPSASLVPKEDPTVLFTTAGMQPLVPYLLGQPHPLGKRLVDSQKCLRTDDIDEVGDAIHHTFFEMLGNWSLGDYFKKESITWSYEFLTEILKLDPKRLHITCFAGDTDAPRDEEAAAIWLSLGIPTDRIYFFGKKDNWWGPAGETGPCGPDTEMHYDLTGVPCGPECKLGCDCGRFSEIWNNVFMEYAKTKEGQFVPLTQKNVDTGMGFERALAVINNFTDNYQTDLWQPVIKKLESISPESYQTQTRRFRIVVDHLRASIFLISAGIEPSNKQQGYILRRLIRRLVVQLQKLQVKDPLQTCLVLTEIFTQIMQDPYIELVENKQNITDVLTQEIQKFSKTLQAGLKKINQLDHIDGKVAFDLFQTFGFPWELTQEVAEEKGIKLDKQEFEAEFKKHQELSRTTSAGMFKGGLADQSEVTTKYHTATHLIHQALRQTLGEHVHQVGSNITGERLRFDFTHPQALTDNEIKIVENTVNEQIGADLPVVKETKTLSEAQSDGALAFFGEKYGESVTVYSIGKFSKEVCGGPHVTHTAQIGPIEIYKQESVGAGKRRLYARLRTQNN